MGPDEGEHGGPTLPPNPYDYSTPATGARFAGRRAEKSRLQDFVDHASSGPRHLLIHGRRGIGKTSLIGQLETLAQGHGLITARLALDEACAAETPFIVESVVALCAAAGKAGLFGDDGGVYGMQLEEALLGRAPANPKGPVRIALFDGTRGRGDRVPELLLARDLADLRSAAAAAGVSGFLLIVDEADHLVQNASTCQRLRNSFIIGAFPSVVLVGTDELASGIDGTLVPLGRHFDRLEVAPLGSVREAAECLRRPLAAAGLAPRRLLPPNLADEVHALAGGRPLEVALLGHMMYAEMVAGEAAQLQLSASVLDATAALLQIGVEESTLAVLRTLEPADLGRAARYCISPDPSLYELALLQLAFGPLSHDLVQTTRAAIYEDWLALVRQDLATIDGELLRPRFGEWSRLYLKYRARATGVLSPHSEGRFADRLANRFADELAGNVPPASLVMVGLGLRVALENGADPTVSEEFEALRDRNVEAFVTGSAFGELPPMLVRADGARPTLLLVTAPFEVRESGYNVLMVLERDELGMTADDLVELFADAFRRAGEYGIAPGRVATIEVDADTWSRARTAATALMGASVGSALWAPDDPSAALSAVEEIHALIEDDLNALPELLEHEVQLINNLGFLRLASRDYEGGMDALSRVAVRGGLGPGRDADQRAILLANLAVAAVCLGRLEEAMSWSSEALDLGEPERPPMVLLAPCPRPDGTLDTRPIKDPSPASIARSVIVVVLAMTGRPRKARTRSRSCARATPRRGLPSSRIRPSRFSRQRRLLTRNMWTCILQP